MAIVGKNYLFESKVNFKSKKLFVSVHFQHSVQCKKMPVMFPDACCYSTLHWHFMLSRQSLSINKSTYYFHTSRCWMMRIFIPFSRKWLALAFLQAIFAMIYYHQMPINKNSIFDDKQSRSKRISMLQRAIYKVENQGIWIVLCIFSPFLLAMVKITEYHFHHDKHEWVRALTLDSNESPKLSIYSIAVLWKYYGVFMLLM